MNRFFAFVVAAVGAAGCFGAEPLYLAVGSYASADEPGIKVLRFDPETARTEFVSELTGVSNPSFQTVNADGTRIYSVAEDDGPEATACAISFDRSNGKMAIINAMPTRGGAPCHIALSPDGRHAVTANYVGGSISIFPVNDDGSLAGPDVIAFEGSGPVPRRQDQPRLHFIHFSPDSRRLMANDLGTDRVHVFALGGDSLVRRDSRRDVAVTPGSGPRHTAWHPTLPVAYMINEISGMVTEFDYDGTTLVPRRYVEADSLHVRGSGDIRISADGHHLYVSNRLEGDGLAIFAVDPDDGSLTRTGYRPTGKHPRNFVLTPDNRYVLVACRDANAVEIYARDADTGLLTQVRALTTPRPVCLTWL